MAIGESVRDGDLRRGVVPHAARRKGCGSLRGLRRLVFVLVVGGLLAAIPLAAVASENVLAGSVRRAEVGFNQTLTDAIRGGLDRDVVDTLTWRYTQVQAIKASSWWQMPIAEHHKLDALNRLDTDLRAVYETQIADSRDALDRQLHRWNTMLAEAGNAGVSLDSLDANTVRFAKVAAEATTPNQLLALASVLSQQYSVLDLRLAAFRTARAQVDAAVQTASALLATAGQYPQLNLAGFKAEVDSATGGLPTVHSADAFGPILAQLQQTGAGV